MSGKEVLILKYYISEWSTRVKHYIHNKNVTHLMPGDRFPRRKWFLKQNHKKCRPMEKRNFY